MSDDILMQLLLGAAAIAAVIVILHYASQRPATPQPTPSVGARSPVPSATVAFEFQDGWARWTVAFDVMRAWVKATHPRQGHGSVEYHIRRVSPSEWEMRVTDLAWAQRLGDLKAAVAANRGPVQAAALAELGAAGTAPQWISFGPTMCSVLETQFHIFIAANARQRGRVGPN